MGTTPRSSMLFLKCEHPPNSTRARPSSFFHSLDTDEQCLHCLADCQRTIYQPTVTAAPFRRCDDANQGISRFCNLEDQKLPQPRIWGQQVLDEYKYLKKDGKEPCVDLTMYINLC